MSEANERASITAAARSWVGTKYHHRAMIKGVGADCATLLVACFVDAGLVPLVELPDYSPQWHLNQSDEKYLGIILDHCAEIDGPPRPGDIAMWRFGRTFAHGAIVTRWPEIIHAEIGVGVMLDDASKSQRLMFIGQGEEGCGKPRDRRFFSYWAKPR